MTNHPNRKRSSGSTVTLVHKHSGFANVADSYKVTEPDNPYVYDPFTQTVEIYYLPDGYTWTEGRDGGLYIYGPDGEHCAIVEHQASGRPQLWGATGQEAPVLKAVSA